MYYRKFFVAEFLKPYVECIYVWEYDFGLQDPVRIESPPNGFASMVFNYGSSYQIRLNDKTVLPPACFITGQALSSYELLVCGVLKCAAIVFKPAGISSLFGLPMYEFTHERLDLREVLGSQIERIIQQIYDSPTASDKAGVLNSFLQDQWIKHEPVTDRTDYAANLLLYSNGACSISELMNELYVCRRQFERQFTLKVGVSPKHFARIRRISVVCREMASRNWAIQDWHQFIHDAGYYDQSHFIKEFKAFTGRPPSVYVKNNSELGRWLFSDA